MFKTLIVAIAGPVLVLFISELFRYLNSRTEKEDRFFDEVYHKRMELYAELIRATDFLPGKEEIPLAESPEKAADFLNEKHRILIEVAVRCVVFGSHRVFHAVNNLCEALDEYRLLLLGEPNNLPMEKFGILSVKMAKARVEIAELIREESGAHIIDNKIADFLRDSKKKQHSSRNVGKEKQSVSD